MKKINVLFLVFLAVFFFAACGSDDEITANPKDDNSSETSDSENGNGQTEDSDNEQNDEDMPSGGGIYVECTPGETRPCYEGPSGTDGVGTCKSGISTCVEDGSDWSECVGQVLPGPEICGNGIDENCDGEDMTPENAVDYDGDGFTYCSGDCCETGWESDCKGTNAPERINPTAYEMTEDGVDNNCNGQIDEVEHCDATLSPLVADDYAGNATKLAQAMGVCTGLISAELSLAGDPITEEIDDRADRCSQPNGDGQTTCTDEKRERMSLDMPYYEGGESIYKTFAVENHFGGIIPDDGSGKIAILSTGPWENPTMNASVATLDAGDMKTASKLPEDWLNMMPGCAVPKAPSCGGQAPQSGLTNQCAGKSESEIPVGQDPIMLTLKIKAPINAEAFEFSLFFMSIEYPGTVCAENNFNDFFVALLDSAYNEKNPNAEFRNPDDKNLAKDELGNPVGVDLAPAGLFKACNNVKCNKGNSVKCPLTGCTVNHWGYCTGDDMLKGTGFESPNITPCISGHGGTGWLRVAGNVVPNEEFTIRLALWEQGTVGYGPDHSYDSTVVLDGFKWLPRPGKPGVTPK